MLSMTEVLAQAVYGLSLRDLPLDVLSTTPNRKRVHSMEKHTTTGGISRGPLRHDHRFSNGFSDIAIIQQQVVPKSRAVSRRTTVDMADGVGDGKGQANLRSSLGAIKELRTQASPLKTGEVNMEMTNMKEERERTGEADLKLEDSEVSAVYSEPIDKPMEVLVNSDPTSPVSGVTLSPMESEESLEAIEVDSLPGQPLLSGSEVHHSGGKKSKRSHATNIFKHLSPDAKQKKRGKAEEKIIEEGGGVGSLTRYSPLLSYDDGSENGTTTGGRGKKKKKTTHKRSGSDTTSHSVSKTSSPRSLAKNNLVHREEEVEEESTDPKAKLVSTPTATRKSLGRRLSIPKSASEGNIRRLSLDPGSAGAPGEEGLGLECSFRRVSIMGSPKGTSDSSSVQDMVVVVESPSISLPGAADNGGNISMSVPTSGKGGKHTVHRSITVDSSEG